MDYPGLHCHTLEMYYVLFMFNLHLNYVEMLESVCLALESGVHGINNSIDNQLVESWTLFLIILRNINGRTRIRGFLVRIVRTSTLFINVSFTDTPFIIHLAHLVGRGWRGSIGETCNQGDL